MDLLEAISKELLSQNNITEATAEVLKGITVPQWHSKAIAETLLDYPSLRDELLYQASSGRIAQVEVSVRSATGRTKPFWDFLQKGVAVLVINER